MDVPAPVCAGPIGLSKPILAVDPEIEIAPYLQIEEQIRGLIQRGHLAPGSLLPTVRQLADDLNVAPNTVARAYTSLQEEGWLMSEGRRGTRVASRLPDVDKRVRTQTLRGSVEHFVSSLVGRGYSRTEILEEIERYAG
jgi:DNA-binding transcriptional regulator YhcF (GntR family)